MALVMEVTEGEVIKIGQSRVRIYKSQEKHWRLAIEAPEHIKITRMGIKKLED